LNIIILERIGGQLLAAAVQVGSGAWCKKGISVASALLVLEHNNIKKDLGAIIN